MQVPMITSSTRSAGTPVRSSNALTQVAPSCAAGTPASAPMKAPIGVLTPVTINDCVLAIVMVLDLAESTHRCVVTRPGLVLRPDRFRLAVLIKLTTVWGQTFKPDAPLDATS